MATHKYTFGPKRFSVDEMPLQKAKVLIVGMGGGCDVIGAYAMAEYLKTKQGTFNGARYYLANTKRRTREKDLTQMSPHIFKIPPQQRLVESGTTTYGTTAVSRSVPRGEGGSPWIIVLPKADDTEGLSQLTEELKDHKFDVIIGIDNGGDSLTGGMDTDKRDEEMMAALRSVGAKFYHFVFGPGCDGESSLEAMLAAVKRQDLAGCYAGSFSLEPVVGYMRKLMGGMERRTPNIIIQGFDGGLKTSKKDGVELVTMPRMGKPDIPRSWLMVSLVFIYDEDDNETKASL